MELLNDILEYTFPDLSHGYVVLDKSQGNGPEIVHWDAEIMGRPCPDEQELASFAKKYAPIAQAKEREKMLKSMTDIIQAHLDTFARTRNYDNIMSAATYATSTVPKFKAEGQYAVEARDATWAKGYEILDEVLSGQRPMPTIEEVIAELPVLAWPELS